MFSHQRPEARGNAHGRVAFLVVAALWAGFAVGRLARMRSRVATPSGESAGEWGAGRPDEALPMMPPEDAAPAMAGADTTDPVSPVRFGNQPDLIATEDAANPPFENLSTNTRFANEINRRTGVRR
ncbi:conserved hypothetical protein [Parafrankia sp. Ea1.12]|nr:conserved hypothetical protein [Parafrankia sp. Ea1.12]